MVPDTVGETAHTAATPRRTTQTMGTNPRMPRAKYAPRAEADAIDMLAQHIITKPVFDALFGSYAFAEHNSVSIAMQSMLTELGDQGLEAERENLQGFYDSVRVRAEGIDNHAGRQQVIVELYDKFLRPPCPRPPTRSASSTPRSRSSTSSSAPPSRP